MESDSRNTHQPHKGFTMSDEMSYPMRPKPGPKSHANTIALQFSLSENAVRNQFPTDSRGFWSSLRKLAEKHSDWEKLVTAMEQAREERQKASRNAKDRDWVPSDVQRAESILERLASSVGKDNARQSSRRDAAENQPDKRGVHFLWICAPNGTDITQHDTQTVPFSLDSLRLYRTGKLSKVTPVLTALRSTLPKSLINVEGDDNDDGIVAHQAVALMLYSQLDDERASAEFQTWSWLSKQLKEDTFLAHVQAIKKPVIVILTFMEKLWDNGLDLKQVYEHLRPLMAVYKSLSVIPSESEAMHYEMKVGDVQAVDEIAANAQNPLYTYRPKTCFGMGNCTLPGPIEPTTNTKNKARGKGRSTAEGSRAAKPDWDMVKKRTWSSCSQHVEPASWSDRRHLRCMLPGPQRRRNGRTIGEPDILWFHQEYIKSLETFGEFRVILTRGRVTKVLRTTRVRDPEGLVIGEAKDEERLVIGKAKHEDFACFSTELSVQKRKLEELKSFAEFVCAELLKREDADLYYKTFEVGGRIDIGISEEGPEGKFFVVELTRFHAAALFSTFCVSMPWTKICEAWATALVEVYA